MTTSLQGRTAFVTGASRGIGRAIAMRLADEGANVVVAAKTDSPHPTLPGTIHTTVAEIEDSGGRASPVALDVRFEDQIERAMGEAIDTFGGVDIVVNNAGAISLTDTENTPAKTFDLLMAVNVRAAYLVTRAALPHLERSENAHVLNLAPPIDLAPRWIAPHVAYTLSKYGMSLCVLGMAEEFRGRGIAVNGLWPRTVIDTAALRRLGGRVTASQCRRPAIVADAALEIVRRDSRAHTGYLHLDEDVLRDAGITDFDRYAVDSNTDLHPDLFIDLDV